ncbi:MAG: site-2 protease family protein, partial [Planctomycetaceae bacterium]
MTTDDKPPPLPEPQHAPEGYAGESNDSGLPVGRWEQRSGDGQLLGEVNFNNGILHGTHRLFREDGSLSHERHYNNGLLTGTGRDFHGNGTTAAEIRYENGQPAEVKSWHETGIHEAESTFHRKQLHGISRSWRPDGSLEYTGRYQYGTKHGDEVAYAADGTVHSSTRYLFGIPDSNSSRLLSPRIQFRLWPLFTLLIILVAVWINGNGNALLMLLVLESAILIHEAGHWACARLAGIPIETFRIGVGPLIAAVRLGRTQLELAVIPVLGYVRPFSLRPSEFSGFTSRDTSHPVDAHEEPTSTAGLVSRPRQFAFLLGGVTANFLLAWLLLWTSAPQLGPVTAAGGCAKIVFKIWASAPQIVGGLLAIDTATEEDKGILRALDDNGTSSRQVRRNSAPQESQDRVRSRTVARVLTYVLVLNLILAAFNLFPFPGLDGYHLAILTIEAVIR